MKYLKNEKFTLTLILTVLLSFANLSFVSAKTYSISEATFNVTEEENLEEETHVDNQYVLTLDSLIEQHFKELQDTKVKNYYDLGKKLGSQVFKYEESKNTLKNINLEKLIDRHTEKLHLETMDLIHVDYDSLIAGFREGLYAEYRNYQMLRLEQTYMAEFNVERYSFSLGPDSYEISSVDKVIHLKFPTGSFYEGVNLEISIFPYENIIANNFQYGKIITRPYRLELESNLPLSTNLFEISFFSNENSNKKIVRYLDHSFTILETETCENKIIANEPINTILQKPVYFLIELHAAANLKDINMSFAQREISYLNLANVICGYEDYTFKPDKGISRLEFLTMIGKALNWPINLGNSFSFHDKNEINFSHSYVDFAVANHIIKGFEDGTFRPNHSISYSEVTTIINRLGNGFVTEEQIDTHWQMKKMHFSKLSTSIFENITREEAAYLIYHLRNGTIYELY